MPKILIRPMNPIEKNECLMDVGSTANLNFSVISHHKGKIDAVRVQEAMKRLQEIHPLLGSTIATSKKIASFVQTSETVPFSEHAYVNADSWKGVVKKELAKRFAIDGKPLWRVSLLKGKEEGQLIVTFHHAIADGVCAMQMMHHFYQILDELMGGPKAPNVPYNDLPVLKNLYRLPAKEAAKPLPSIARVDKKQRTDFVHETLDEVLSSQIMNWTKAQGIKMNAVLLAALLQAVQRVAKPHFKEVNAVTVVNFRSYFDPPISKDTLSLLRTCISENIPIEELNDFTSLAKKIHESVHTQLKEGKHITNLKALEQILLQNLSAKELWSGAKFSSNSITITNLGALDFSGKYSRVTLDELFFVANVEPFIEEAENFVLGAVSFQGKISLSLWFLEGLVSESTGKNVLREMKEILQEAVSPILIGQ